ncbi:MAG: hypothetical protein ACREOF_03210 [Gemmatimonadales bacterium]
MATQLAPSVAAELAVLGLGLEIGIAREAATVEKALPQVADWPLHLALVCAR